MSAIGKPLSEQRVLAAFRQMPVGRWIEIADRDANAGDPWQKLESSPLTLTMMRILSDQGRIDIVQRRRGDRIVQLAQRRREAEPERPAWFGERMESGSAGRVR